MWTGETWRESAERIEDDSEREGEREGGNLERRGVHWLYLLFLVSSLPPPLASEEGGGRSDDALWRTSTSRPLSLKHTRTASSLWQGGETARVRREAVREGVITKEIP